jgi:hypothetical protein
MLNVTVIVVVCHTTSESPSSGLVDTIMVVIVAICHASRKIADRGLVDSRLGAIAVMTPTIRTPSSITIASSTGVMANHPSASVSIATTTATTTTPR